MDIYDYYNQSTSAFDINSSSVAWNSLSLILAIIGGIVLYFMFIKPEKKYENKTVNMLREILSFKTLFLETILKITYLILALYVTLLSFNYVGVNFWYFILVFFIGNVVLRIAYESALVILIICKNTSEINRKLTKSGSKKIESKVELKTEKISVKNKDSDSE